MKTALLLLSLCAALSAASVVRSASVERAPASVRLSGGRSPHEPLRLSVKAFAEEHHLRLVPAPSPFAKDFKLQTTARDSQGRLVIRDVGEDSGDVSGLYHDPDTDAVVRVDGAVVEGLLTPTLSIRASEDGAHEAQRHIVAEPSALRDYLELPKEVRQYEPVPSTSTRGAVTASPEVLVIVDSTLAAALGTDDKVKEYLAVFWNGVNKRFATMSDPKVNLVLTGALIVRESGDEPYISDNVLSGNFIHGEKSLKSVSDWLFQKRGDLAAYDLAYLMTGKDMADVNSGAIQKGLAGIAWRGAACVVATSNNRSFNTAMGEDMDVYYTGVMTAAHEVAHNLGSPHDGSNGAEACSWNLGYIMSYVSGNVNTLFFSSCSQELMKKYILTTDGSCLRSTESQEEIALSSQLPGQLVTMDEQCQKFTGESGAFASKSVSDDSLCVQLQCQWQKQEGMYIYTYTRTSSQPAAEGTACRSGGSCINGSCKP